MIEKLKRFNWISFGAMIALIALGTVAVWSSGHARETVFHRVWLNHLGGAAVGLCAYFALAACDYRRLFDIFAKPAYSGALVLLVAVLLFGAEIDGGRRWLWFFQPSELAKLCVIVFLAQLFGAPDGFRGRFGFRGAFAAAFVLGLPCVLILLEPDLGTALALVPAGLVMLLAAGVWRRGLLLILAIGGILAATVLGVVFEAERPGVSPEKRERILAYVPLKPHQVQRVKTFLFPESDPLGAGYNLKQALIAIGSGGYSGKGVGKGESNHLKYLPPSVSMNDFIFCVYAEETGFVGSLALLALYGLVCLSGVWVAWRAGEGRGRLVALGVSTLVFAHVYVNIAMSIGLVPITGIPLPFISAGRTFLVTVIAGLGLVQSVSLHREEIT